MPHIINVTLVSGLGADGRVATDPEWASELDLLQVRNTLRCGHGPVTRIRAHP
jgi:hypothetical protein